MSRLTTADHRRIRAATRATILGAALIATGVTVWDGPVVLGLLLAAAIPATTRQERP